MSVNHLIDCVHVLTVKNVLRFCIAVYVAHATQNGQVATFFWHIFNFSTNLVESRQLSWNAGLELHFTWPISIDEQRVQYV